MSAPVILALLLHGAAGGHARVDYVTRTRAFFDAGTDAGLEAGTDVRLLRRGTEVGGCRITVASAHHASCGITGGVRIGDEAFFEPKRMTPAPPPPPTIEAGPKIETMPADEAQRMQEALRAAPLDKVKDEASAPDASGLRLRGSLAASHEAWVVVGGDRTGGDFQSERVDVFLGDLPLGFLGATANVDLTAVAWSRRPDGTRFRPGATAQLYVYETSVSSRDPDRSFTASIGRIRPWHAPGLLFVDGLQVGWRPKGGRLELGVVGGSLPDAVRLEPSVQRWVLDGYWSVAAGGPDLYLASDGRIGLARAPELGSIGELETDLSLQWSELIRTSVGGRAVLDSDGPALAGLRAFAEVRPISRLRFAADFRTRDDRLEAFAPTLGVIGATHGSFTASWWVIDPLEIALSGSAVQLPGDDALRGFAGPELRFPRLFGQVGSLSVGYQEALGWLPGRSSWVQALLHPAPMIDLMARLAYFDDTVGEGALRELGTFAHLDWRVIDHFAVRASLFAHAPVDDLGAALTPIGFVGRLSLVGEL